MSTPQTPPAPAAANRRSTKSRQRLVLVVGVVLLVALVTWLVTRGDDDKDDGAAASKSLVEIGVPTVLSESDLRKWGAAQETPIYWAGPLPNRRYEATQTSQGRYFVRYLTPRADIGDAAPRFLTVGTYPGTNAYGALQTVGRRKDSVRVRTRSGALVVYSKDQPTSVYFAFPGQNFQVEVYDPRSSRARRFVLGGRLERLR